MHQKRKLIPANWKSAENNLRILWTTCYTIRSVGVGGSFRCYRKILVLLEFANLHVPNKSRAYIELLFGSKIRTKSTVCRWQHSTHTPNLYPINLIRVFIARSIFESGPDTTLHKQDKAAFCNRMQRYHIDESHAKWIN